MEHVHILLKLAGANSHKRDTVAVRFVHIRLNFEHKRRKVGVGVYYSVGGFSRSRRRSEL